jgi:hypothetical protein
VAVFLSTPFRTLKASIALQILITTGATNNLLTIPVGWPDGTLSKRGRIEFHGFPADSVLCVWNTPSEYLLQGGQIEFYVRCGRTTSESNNLP